MQDIWISTRDLMVWQLAEELTNACSTVEERRFQRRAQSPRAAGLQPRRRILRTYLVPRSSAEYRLTDLMGV